MNFSRYYREAFDPNIISNYKGRTDLVDLYGDNSLLLYALQLRYDIEDIISVASEA